MKIPKISGKLTENNKNCPFSKSSCHELDTKGIKAICDLEQLERERGNKEYVEEETTDNTKSHTVVARTASNEMYTFLVMNISSL